MQRLRFRLPPEREDELAAELWSLGTRGLEIRQTPGGAAEIDAYFAADEAARAARDWPALAAVLIGREPVTEADWLAGYRRMASPFDVGAGFRVDPADPAGPPPGPVVAPGARRLLSIPARTAFGTGSHASTRLAVALLEAEPPRGARLLDVGAGSGILAMVGLCLGAERAVGIEIDPHAVFVAAENRHRNRLPIGLVAGTLAALRAGAPFDRFAVNMTINNLAPLLGDLARVLPPGARGVVSGILAEQEAELERRLEAAGFAAGAERREEDEWIARTATRRPG